MDGEVELGTMPAAHDVLDPWEHWRAIGSPRNIAAPMIDGSELAFRMLVREWGDVNLAWTPMLHADAFLNDAEYSRDVLSSCAADRPLAIQIGGCDSQTMLRAAQAALARVPADAIDINLGCPQDVARRGGYGAFLCDTPQRVAEIVGALRRNLAVPVWAKTRLLPGPPARTVDFARQLEACGAALVTVHGRTRQQVGRAAGAADWAAVGAVKAALRVPVVANGGVASAADAGRCLRETGADGAMAAEALLYDPFLFARPAPRLPDTPLANTALYLDYAEQYQAPLAYARCHVARLWGHRNPKRERPSPDWMGDFWFKHQPAWARLAAARSLADMRALARALADGGGGGAGRPCPPAAEAELALGGLFEG